MRRRTQIILTVTFMVAVLVSAFSYIYISQLLQQSLLTTRRSASYLASQLAYIATNAVPDLTSTKVDTNNPAAVRAAFTYYLSTDRDLNALVDSVVQNWPAIQDAAVVDPNGRAILHTRTELTGKAVSERPDFSRIVDSSFRSKLRLLYNGPTVYDVRTPLLLNDVPFGSVRVGISTVFLRNELTPLLQRATIIGLVTILLSLLFASALSRLALGPLERISRTLDSVSAGSPNEVAEESDSHDEYGLVTLKIAHLGRQMRDAREIFSALKDNVDQIMANLQDGLMLFTRESNVVLVSASVERFLGRPRRELLGRTAKQIFSADSELGSLVLDAFRLRHPFELREIESANGRRAQVSLDFIQERGTQIGALLTMRDTESARRIEDEIETSRRLSASGRLTRGVAHEVKNPINAIVLHLQLLQNKLKEIDPETRRHMDIIDSEIHRLDRVVQVLVDFTRPRDLHTEAIDFRRLLEEVAVLAAPDAEQHRVTVEREFSADLLTVKVDADFMKQAVLNVILNGVQAMPQGGVLTLSARREDDMVVAAIRDEGTGIAPEVQEKMFELYFTTKKSGSGIGLAQTYQIMQWHYGSVEFESLAGRGTVFTLRLPWISPATDSLQEAGAQSHQSNPS
ncbi:MAG: two-component system sensor histidine kinase NtrB [Terriglobales bacterium]